MTSLHIFGWLEICSILIMMLHHRYFSEPDNMVERAHHDAVFSRIMNDSTTFHLWNSITSALVPEANSLVERILNSHCLHCLDVL
jgi:hypothetical protein